MCHDSIDIRKVMSDLTSPFSDQFLSVIVVSQLTMS